MNDDFDNQPGQDEQRTDATLDEGRSYESIEPVVNIEGAIAIGILLLSIVLLWFSAGDHPLYPPDEGRYATVSAHMAQGGDWIVPRFDGHVHLTKPPFTYWMQALALRGLGHTGFALRTPSLVAGTLSLGLLFFMGWRLRGPRLAGITVALATVMPLFLIVNRLAITDPLLHVCWLGALIFGWLAASEGKWRWSFMLWLCIAIGLMVKGPLALSPVGLLILWLLFSRNGRGFRRLHLWLGLPLALVPLVIWVWSIVQHQPEAWSIWRLEIIARINGGEEGPHDEPFWFYLPIFLGGLFPITTMLPLPGRTVRWRILYQHLSSGTPAALWGLAAIIPLILFSLMSGKLQTYLLPLCGPWAILTAVMLDDLITGKPIPRSDGTKPPEVIVTFTICLLLITIGMLGAAWIWAPKLLWAAASWVPASVVALWAWRIWKRKPHLRGMALGAVWLMFLVGWLGVYEGEDDLRSREAPIRMIGWLDGYMSATGDHDPPTIVVYGYRNHILNFYLEHDLQHVYSPVDLRNALQSISGPCLVFADLPAWNTLIQTDSSLGDEFETIDSFTRWFAKETLMLRWRSPPGE